MSDVLKQALKLVKPTQKEIDFIDGVANKVIVSIKESSSKFNEVVDIIFGGSYAKFTWLKNDVDIDIFVKVRCGTDEKEFEKIGRDLGFHAFKKYKPYLR